MAREWTGGRATAVAWLLLGAWVATGGLLVERLAYGEEVSQPSVLINSQLGAAHFVLVGQYLRSPLGGLAWLGLLLLGSLPYHAGASPSSLRWLSGLVVAGATCVSLALAFSFLDIWAPAFPASLAYLALVLYPIGWCAIALELLSAQYAPSPAREAARCLVIAAPIAVAVGFVAGRIGAESAVPLPFLLVPLPVALGGSAWVASFLAVLAIRAEQARTRACTQERARTRAPT